MSVLQRVAGELAAIPLILITRAGTGQASQQPGAHR